jgi:hypothetical protein
MSREWSAVLPRPMAQRRVAVPDRGQPRKGERQNERHKPSELKAAWDAGSQRAWFQFRSTVPFSYPGFTWLEFQVLLNALNPGKTFTRLSYRRWDDPRGIEYGVPWPIAPDSQFGY